MGLADEIVSVVHRQHKDEATTDFARSDATLSGVNHAAVPTFLSPSVRLRLVGGDTVADAAKELHTAHNDAAARAVRGAAAEQTHRGDHPDGVCIQTLGAGGWVELMFQIIPFLAQDWVGPVSLGR